MSIFDNKIKKLQAVNFSSILQSVIEIDEVQQEIVKLNQDQLFEEGVQADNTITGTYAPMTYNLKAAKGQRNDHITLSDTGDFYESMKVVPLPEGFKITGDTQKPDQNLSDRWPKALGLTPDNQEVLMPIIEENVFNKLKAAV